MAHFERHGTDFQQLMGMLAQILQTTPAGPGGTIMIAPSHLARFEGVLIEFHFRSLTLARYLAAEAEEGNFLAIVPPEAVRRLADVVDVSLTKARAAHFEPST